MSIVPEKNNLRFHRWTGGKKGKKQTGGRAKLFPEGKVTCPSLPKKETEGTLGRYFDRGGTLTPDMLKKCILIPKECGPPVLQKRKRGPIKDAPSS